MQAHSESERSVWFALFMSGILPGHCLTTPFQTVSEVCSAKLVRVKAKGSTLNRPRQLATMVP
jgi:hypothetical protein